MDMNAEEGEKAPELELDEPSIAEEAPAAPARRRRAAV